MNQSHHEDKILEMAYRNGWDVPEEFADAPELLPGLALYYIAFWDLVNDRGIGMTAGPIWWLSISTYCQRHGFSFEQEVACQRHIREMDSVYLKHLQEKPDADDPVQQRDEEAGESGGQLWDGDNA